MDYSLPGSSVHGILQGRILEWIAVISSKGSFWAREQIHIPCMDRKIPNYWATWEARNLEQRWFKVFLSPSSW